MQKGYVAEIFIADEAGAPMRSVDTVRAVKCAGLEGDRYASEKGSFSNATRQTIRQVTLIARELIFEANAELSPTFTFEETRRNIVMSGIEPDKLIGTEFAIGSAWFFGIEECSPCERPSKLSEKPGFKKAFQSFRGGIRAEALEGGVIRVGDPITAKK